MSLIARLAYLTTDLPGTGGVIKQREDDFLVEEQPLYEPIGEGEHIYLFIEKRGLTTPRVVRALARAFSVGRGAVSYAGLKDKHAVTRQHFSIHRPGRTDPADGLANLEHHPGLKVLWADRHTNKLRRGHLRGNRFVIRIREVEPTHVLAARKILDVLAQRGIPDYIGEQRFGYRQNGHVVGRLLLLGEPRAMLDEMLGQPREVDSPALQAARAAYDRGDYEAALDQWPRALPHDRRLLDNLRQGKTPRQAVASLDQAQRKLLIAAWQSAPFNAVLDRRLRQGAFDRLVAGDLAWKHDNGAVFAVDQATAERENAREGRVQALAVSPSGPLWGPQMLQARGEPGRIEHEMLAAHGLTEEQLAGAGEGMVKGKRRPLRVPLREPDISGGVDEHGSYIRLAFELPRGAYATIALREIMKTDTAPNLPDEET